jgi:hypothetical protein
VEEAKWSSWLEHLGKNNPLPTIRRPLVLSPLPPSRHPCLRRSWMSQDIGVGEVAEALNKYPGKAPAERSGGCSDHSKGWAWT